MKDEGKFVVIDPNQKGGVKMIATVRHIVAEGDYSPYAVATGHWTSDGRPDEIMIQLDPSVWQDEKLPQVGDEVFASVLYHPADGWSRGFSLVREARFALPSDPRKRQKPDESMAHELSFERNKVFVAGTKVLEVPFSDQGVAVVGYWQVKNSRLDVGTGYCCHGYVWEVCYTEKQGYFLNQVIAVDLNVEDLIRACADHKIHRCGNGDSVLVAGHGCAGGGVRLVTLYYPHVVEVLSEEEYRKLLPEDGHGKPMFRIDQKDWRIHLDVLRAGYRLKPGKKRKAGLPSILLDSEAEEYYVNRADIYGSIDITDKLRQTGVHVDETICMADDYRRQWERH